MENEELFTFAEVASQLGITESELIELAKSEGLIDDDGFPTQKAFDAGLLTVESGISINFN